MGRTIPHNRQISTHAVEGATSVATAGWQPAPRKIRITWIVFFAAVIAGALNAPGHASVALGILIGLCVVTDLLQPRDSRRALQALPYDASLYAAMILLPGGTAALLGAFALGAAVMRRQPLRLALTRAAFMAVSGLAGGHAVSWLLLLLPGWIGHVAALLLAPLLVVTVISLWRPSAWRGWRTLGNAELQAAAAGWLLATQLGAGDYMAAVLTAGLFIAVRRYLLQRTQTVASNWRLADRERVLNVGMEAVREAVRKLNVATTPQALTAALAEGAAALPGVVAVAVWEAAGSGPPRLAAFSRAHAQGGTGDDDKGSDGADNAAAVLSALPPPGVAQALRAGIVQGDTACYVPLRSGPSVQSVAEVSLRTGSEPALMLHLFSIVVDYFRARLKNLDLLSRAQDDFIATVRVLAATVDARDHYTRRHSENVSVIARRIAAEMDLSAEEIGDIAMAALLHDIGKIGIPDAVLTKKGPLDVAERQLMMSHAEVGASIVAQAEPLVHLAPLVRHHHEWHDGNGYPDGLKGEEIPLGAAIIAVADAYDTMTSDRPYRPGVKPEAAVAELQRCAGTQFHPAVVAAAVRLHERGALPRPTTSDGALPDETHRTLAGRHHQAQFMTVRMLQRLAAEMSLVLNLDELLNRSLAIIRDEIGFTTGGLLLKEPDGNIRLSAATGFLTPLVGTQLPPGCGLSRWVIEHGQPLRVDDVSQDPRYYVGPGAGPVGSELAVPLTVAGETLGCLIVSSERTYGFTEQDEALLTAAAGPLAQAIRVALLHRSTLPATETDSLTGALNRRGIERELANALAQASEKAPVWLAAFDMKGLAHFNRVQGFRAGDAALQALVRHLGDALGRDAKIGRLGGDQLLAILPPGTGNAAKEVVESAVASWKGTKVEVEGTVSSAPPVVGAAVRCPRDLSRVDEVMNWADNFPDLTPENAKRQLAATAGD